MTIKRVIRSLVRANNANPSRVQTVLYKVEDALDYIAYDLDNAYLSVRHGVRRICNFIKWGYRLNNTHPWDWGYLLVHMEYWLKDAEKHHITKGLHSNRERVARDLKIARVLCRRLIDDNYYQLEHPFGRTTRKPGSKYSTPAYDVREEAMERDKKYLFDLINKKLRLWWD